MAKKQVKSTKVEGKTLVEATARGFLSDEGRMVREGEQFYVDAKLAEKGAEWFEKVEADAAEQEIA